MNRTEPRARIAARPSLSKDDVAAALGSLTSAIADALVQGETVTVAGCEKFAPRTRAPRQGHNPLPR